MLSAPTSTAPAASRRATSVASAVAGGRSRLIFEPARVASPATSNRFLTANGTPASGPSGRPLARSASMARALASARSRVTAVKALSALSRSAMRASAASTTATALARPPATACAISVAVAQASMALGLEHRRRLGLVRQRELGHHGGEPQRDGQVGPDGGLPFGLDRQRQRSRARIDQRIQLVVLHVGPQASETGRSSQAIAFGRDDKHLLWRRMGDGGGPAGAGRPGPGRSVAAQTTAPLARRPAETRPRAATPASTAGPAWHRNGSGLACLPRS